MEKINTMHLLALDIIRLYRYINIDGLFASIILRSQTESDC